MNRFTKVRSSSLRSSIQRSGSDCDIDKMKAHFRFIGNNKMKVDFCFIDNENVMAEHEEISPIGTSRPGRGDARPVRFDRLAVSSAEATLSSEGLAPDLRVF